MLQEEELKGAPVLILANKQDLPGALNEMEVSLTWKNRYNDFRFVQDLG